MNPFFFAFVWDTATIRSPIDFKYPEVLFILLISFIFLFKAILSLGQFDLLKNSFSYNTRNYFLMFAPRKCLATLFASLLSIPLVFIIKQFSKKAATDDKILNILKQIIFVGMASPIFVFLHCLMYVIAGIIVYYSMSTSDMDKSSETSTNGKTTSGISYMNIMRYESFYHFVAGLVFLVLGVLLLCRQSSSPALMIAFFVLLLVHVIVAELFVYIVVYAKEKSNSSSEFDKLLT